MAKVTDDKKLPLGVAIEPSHVRGNLQKVADSFAANVILDQRKEGIAPFSVSWFYSSAKGELNNVNSSETHFMLPPLQTDWDDNLVTNESMASVTLDSISFGFDLMNQGKAIDPSTALPGSADMGDVTLSLFKLHNNPDTTDPPASKSLVAEVLISSAEIAAQFNTRNPTNLRDLGISMDRFAVYEWVIECGETLFSVWIRATFLHPVVSRDTAAVLGDALNAGTPVDAQNAPDTALYNKSPATMTLTAPAADALIEASSATVGVQTQIEEIDTAFRRKLVGGRADHYQSDLAFATDRKEALLDDSGYFCMCVNLMKQGEPGGWIHGGNAANWQVVYPNTGTNALWDRALIPISYPGTIHHVILEAAGITDFARKNPGTVAIGNRSVDVGVGLYRGVRVSNPTYQQVAFLSTSLTGTSGNLLKNRMWQVPLVWSSAGPAMGKGFVQQGRPVYFGRQLTYDGTVNREPIADIVGSSSAEAVAATGGLENFIEVRLMYERGTGATWATGAATDYVLSNGGFNVYIIGKMGLKE